MPLVRIDLIAGKPETYRQALADGVYETMVAELKVPENDRFQVVVKHSAGNFFADPTYLGIRRSADCVFVQITLNAGRGVATRQAFYARLADVLEHRAGLCRADLIVNLVEVQKEAIGCRLG